MTAILIENVFAICMWSTASKNLANEVFILSAKNINTKLPVLVTVKCEALPEISSGSITVVTNGTASVAEFSCKSGYSLAGNQQVTCLTDASWDGGTPTCGK